MKVFSRISWFAGVLFIALLGGCSSITQPVTDWFEDEEVLAVRTLEPITNVVDMTVQWQRDVGNGIGDYFSRLQPQVANGKVFAADRQGLIVAFDSRGQTLWQTRINDSDSFFSSAPSAKLAGGITISEAHIWIGSEDGRLLGLNQETGAIEKDIDVAGEIIAAPSVGDGLVVVNTTSGRLFAYNIETGEEAWMHESDVPPLSLRGTSSPLVANGGVLVGTAAGKLQVNIVDSGLVAWEATVTTPSGATELERIIDVDSQPLIVGANVYIVSFNGGLTAVELRSGRVVWKREYASYRNLTLAGNRLIVSDINGNIFALDVRNGVEMWSQSTFKGRDLTAGVMLGKYLAFGDNFGVIHLVDPIDGSLVSRKTLGNDKDERFFAPGVVANNTLYIQNAQGTLFALGSE